MKEAPLFIHIPGIPEYLLYTWVIMAMLFAVSFAVSRGIKPLPAGI